MTVRQEIHCGNSECGAIVAVRTASTLRVSSRSDVYYYQADDAYKGVCPRCGRAYRFVLPNMTLSTNVDGTLVPC